MKMGRSIRWVGSLFVAGLALTQYTEYDFSFIANISERRLENSDGSTVSNAVAALTKRRNSNNSLRRALQGRSVERLLVQKLPLRCAVFGNVDTYGSMKFQHGNREASFAYQICDIVKNYGHFSRGSNYASTCLQSLVGDEIFDLIILDFDGKPADDLKLAQRLYERFPTAQFMVLDRFQPSKVVYTPQGNAQWSNELFRYQFGVRHRQQGPDKFSKDRFKGVIQRLEKNKKKREDLGRTFYYRNSKKDTIEQLVQQYNAIPITLGNEKNIERSLLETVNLYNDEGTMLSQDGHNFVASKIIGEARKVNVAAISEADLGTFGPGDVCHTWNDSGEVDLSTGLQVESVEYAKRRHALKFPERGEWVRIENPSSTNGLLYISYVVTPGSERVHSRAKIVVESSGINILVDTLAYNGLDENKVTPRTIPVGTITPGTHFVWIRPENDAPEPFYLTGLVISDLPKKYAPHEYSFESTYWASEGAV